MFVHISTAYILFFLISPNNASGAEFDCPQSISTTQKITQLPMGWKQTQGSLNYSTANLKLINVRFFIGKLEKHEVELSPSQKSNQPDIETWNFSNLKASETVFQICEYSGTVVRIEKQLPKTIRRCHVKHSDLLAQSRESSAEDPIKKINCE